MRDYLADGFYTKGLLKREVVQDKDGRPFTETEHGYVLRDVDTGAEPADPASTTATVFPTLTRTDRRFHEGGASPGKTRIPPTSTTRSATSPASPTPATPAPPTTWSPSSPTPACPNYLVKPTRIDVTGGGAALRRREATLDCATGNVTEVRQVLANGSAATTNLAYLPNGNLQSVTGPANHAGQRYALSYEYDPVVATHVATRHRQLRPLLPGHARLPLRQGHHHHRHQRQPDHVSLRPLRPRR